MEKSKQCLKTAILGERGAVLKYTSFAAAAEKGGKGNLARLFRALVQAEEIHIKNHLSALGDEFAEEATEEIQVASALENVQTAISGEVEEAKRMYPEFMRTVKKEGSEQFYKVAQLSLDWAAKAEKKHAALLNVAKKALNFGGDFPHQHVYVCRVCGNLEVGEKPTNVCPVCGHDEAFFQLVD